MHSFPTVNCCNLLSVSQLIDYQGREALKTTKEQAENQLNLDVIYGDTDSIMVNTRIPSVPGPDADPALSDSATGACLRAGFVLISSDITDVYVLSQFWRRSVRWVTI